MTEFQLRITTAQEGLQLLEQGWPTKAVSLIGDDLCFHLPSFGSHHFIARFHDVETSIEGFVAPDRHTLQAALDHAAGLKAGDRLLIHCHAGKSRSPALALGVLVAAGLTPAKALKRVKGIRPFVIPNRRMVALIDDILGAQGKLTSVVAEHYATLPPEASLPDRGGWNHQ